MQKLMVDCRMIDSSGIGVYLQNLLPYLKDHFSLKLLGNPEEIKHHYLHDYLDVIKFNAPIYSVKEQSIYPFKLKNTDIFWSPHYNVPVLPIRSKKRVTTIHDLNHLALKKYISFSQKLYARFMMNRAVKSSDRLITVSKFSLNEIVKYTGVTKKKIKYIYNGVNVDMFKPDMDNSIVMKVKKKYHLPMKYILYVGNIKPHKNLKLLLKAYENVIQTNTKDYYLVIVGKEKGYITGDKDIFNILQNSNTIKKRVIFTDYVENDDLPVLYNLAGLFVFPSLYEGFGLPPLEAMACGCPVITSNATCLPEICGDAACYVNPDNEKELAEKIISVLFNKHLKKELIEKGIKRTRLFKWEDSAKQHIELFNEVLQN